MTSHDYLGHEFAEMIGGNPEIIDFLQAGPLDGIWYWDLERPENAFISPRFWKVCGYDPATRGHAASDWQNQIHPDDRISVLKELSATCDNSGRHFDREVRFLHKNGSTVWMRCHGLVIGNDDGKPVRLLGTHTDISALKESQDALLESDTRLEISIRELEQFAYVTSHDLKQPLRIAASFAELLAKNYRGKLDDKADQYIDYILNEARYMQQLLDDLLKLSRIDTRFDPSTTNCGILLEDILQELKAEIDETDAEVAVGPLPTIRADPKQIRQVFMNILRNAIKFRSEERPRIGITATRDCGTWNFSIADNGIGIDSEFHDRIFTIFQKLHARDEYPGTGIGLTIVKKIIDRHGGQISIDSASGHGTRINFSIPAQDNIMRSSK